MNTNEINVFRGFNCHGFIHLDKFPNILEVQLEKENPKKDQTEILWESKKNLCSESVTD